jgi:arsenate reductase
MGCGDACPDIPGKRCVDWDLTDGRREGPVSQVRAIRGEIAHRVGQLPAELDSSASLDAAT